MLCAMVAGVEVTSHRKFVSKEREKGKRENTRALELEAYTRTHIQIIDFRIIIKREGRKTHVVIVFDAVVAVAAAVVCFFACFQQLWVEP